MNIKDHINLKAIQAFLFLLIPIALYLEGGFEWQKSISAYYQYSPTSFGALLGAAGMLFFEDGWSNRERRHNVTLGLSLWGVLAFNHESFPIIHYAFAIYFFIGSQILMIWKSSKEQRWWKILISLMVNLSGVMCFAFGWFSILVFEWIALLPMSVHFAGEAKGKID